MPDTLNISIEPCGRIIMIYDDDLAPLLSEGEARIERASHVEPASSGWIADMSPVHGPTIGPFPLRSEALSAEVAWIKEHIL
jgi:hypothetical protein